MRKTTHATGAPIARIALAVLTVPAVLAAPVTVFPARHARTGSGGDPRITVVRAFWQCVKRPGCTTGKILTGPTARDLWKRIERKRKQRGIVVKNTALVPTVPARFADRWKRQWSAATAELNKAGYNASRLKKLGLGRAVVRASANVAVAFTSVAFERRGRAKTEYLMLVLWRVKGKWYVAYWEDSPAILVRFMKSNRPR